MYCLNRLSGTSDVDTIFVNKSSILVKDFLKSYLNRFTCDVTHSEIKYTYTYNDNYTVLTLYKTVKQVNLGYIYNSTGYKTSVDSTFCITYVTEKMHININMCHKLLALPVIKNLTFNDVIADLKAHLNDKYLTSLVSKV